MEEQYIDDRFEELSDYGSFEKIENKLSNRPDLHAFLRLEEWFPTDNNSDILGHAEHDKVWLNADEDLLDELTDEQIIELSRCGVMCHDGYLTMFV